MDRTLTASVSPACCHQRSAQHRHPLTAGPLPRRHPQQRCRQPCRRMQLRALQQVGEADFEAEVLQADKPVLIDFWAPWCGPCKLIEPIVDGLQKDYAHLKVVKVNADASKSIVEKYKVYGLPTLMVIKDGKKLEGSHKEGAMQKKMIIDHLNKLGLAPQ